jgi:acyl phosphate:glycerol-3-phosphate acyltransferase
MPVPVRLDSIRALTRYSSLAALLPGTATPAVPWWHGDAPKAKLFLLLSTLLWITHYANIAWLVRGTESKIGKSSA